ncbi:MAG: hypothetical protein A3G87_06215 [Omnitrophica bacterium RIFCSPLOWO2_12_FULL_50_11]|nr:MAG: hypothetical protein A3G87_06215 [Omnitrophica bacterium RIFCSPLOWO2_12_FULL_50_11]
MVTKAALKTARVGKINYINTIPFYRRLFDDDTAVSILEGSPAEINRAMRKGVIDFAPISSLEYALAQDQYLLLPDLCIGSRDFSRSVLLLSHEKIEGLNREKILVSAKSLSSQALLKILLRFKYHFENQFQTSNATPDVMLQKGKAALTIGDDALFFEPRSFVYKYDLSELWWNWRGLPFCFAVWAVRRAFYEARRDEVIEFHQKLKRTVEENMMDLEKLLSDALEITLSDKRFPQVFGYLFNLSLCLDDEMTKGLDAFYGYAARAGLAPEVKELNFIEVEKASGTDLPLTGKR